MSKTPVNEPLLAEVMGHVEAVIYHDVRHEVGAQIDKWGVQHHPNGTGGEGAKRLAEHAKKITDKAAEAGEQTWKFILNEEVLEAFAEADDDMLEMELVQVAAVAVSWVRDIQARRRESRG